MKRLMFEFFQINHESEYSGDGSPILRLFTDPVCDERVDELLDTLNFEQGVVVVPSRPNDEVRDAVALFSITVGTCIPE